MGQITKQFISIFLSQLNGWEWKPSLPSLSNKMVKNIFLNENLLLTCIFHRVDSDTVFCTCQTSGKYHSNILQTVHGTAHRSAVPLNNKHQYKHKYTAKTWGIIGMVGPAAAGSEGECSSHTCCSVWHSEHCTSLTLNRSISWFSSASWHSRQTYSLPQQGACSTWKHMTGIPLYSLPAYRSISWTKHSKEYGFKNSDCYPIKIGFSRPISESGRLKRMHSLQEHIL